MQQKMTNLSIDIKSYMCIFNYGKITKKTDRLPETLLTLSQGLTKFAKNHFRLTGEEHDTRKLTCQLVAGVWSSAGKKLGFLTQISLSFVYVCKYFSYIPLGVQAGEIPGSSLVHFPRNSY